MNDFSERIAALSSAKRELLLKRIKKEEKIANRPESFKTKDNEMTVEDLTAEACLDSKIFYNTKSYQPLGAPASVFLTGATGFVGAFLLYELVKQTQANIYCLVRASDPKEGRRRIENCLKSYLIWDEDLGSRIIPVVGDLTQPLLGLSHEQFQVMASQIDTIYHCGALVKWIYPYEALKLANVFGTQEIIRLAFQSKVKPLHFISTVGVFSSPTYSLDTVSEEEILENSGPLHVGYAQTKWVAEKLVRIAGSRGLPISIYRPNTEGHSKTGVFNKHDHLCKIIKGCIQMGSVPLDLDLVIASAPIDYVSKAIIYLSKQHESFSKVFHLVNPLQIQWSEFIKYLPSLGYPLRQLSYQDWTLELMSQVRNSQNHELYGLSPLFSDSSVNRGSMRYFDCKNTLEGLAGTSIVCPPIDLKLLKTYFSYFVSSGFLDAPKVGIID